MKGIVIESLKFVRVVSQIASRQRESKVENRDNKENVEEVNECVGDKVEKTTEK